MNSGRIDPVLYRVFPFKSLPEALDAIESRKSFGKVVLSIDDASVSNMGGGL